MILPVFGKGDVKIWKVADGTVVKAFNGSPGLVTAAAPAAATKK